MDTRVLRLELHRRRTDERLRLLGEPRPEESGPFRLTGECGLIDAGRSKRGLP
jgi:hypothetical protein